MAATVTALVDRGYDTMSMESIAAAAETSKTTVYRWWPRKADLAVEAFFDATSDELRLPDTGDPAADFRHQIVQLTDVLAGPNGRAFAAMIAGARTEPTLAEALRTRWLDPRRAWGLQHMNKAIADGRTHPHVTAEPALALLYSPVYTPLLFGQNVPRGAQLDAILDLALAGIFRDPEGGGHRHR